MEKNITILFATVCKKVACFKFQVKVDKLRMFSSVLLFPFSFFSFLFVFPFSGRLIRTVRPFSMFGKLKSGNHSGNL